MSRLHSSPAHPLDVEDLLQEILLRLPPQPSSLPRASGVCKRWCSILSDPGFLRRFRLHHRKPPLLGFFVEQDFKAPIFTPILDPPHRIPVACFVLPQNLVDRRSQDLHFFGCRYGVALFLDRMRREVIIWDPITSVQCQVDFPPGLVNYKDSSVQNAAVLCSVDDNQHAYDYCHMAHMSSFKLVLACSDYKTSKAFICIYESESGVWGNIISTANTEVISQITPSILVGNALCWLLSKGNILEFDFEKQTLVIIEKPKDARATNFSDQSFRTLRGEDNGLGLAILSRSKLSIQLWARKSSCGTVVSWVLQNTIQLNEFSSLKKDLRMSWV